MKRILLSLVAFGTIVHCARSAEFPDPQTQAKAALSILDPWQQAEAETAQRFLHIVCWTPADREFPANHHDRLSRILKHIQSFYADEMERHGFGPRTFNLSLTQEQRVVIHDVRGLHPTNHYGKKSGNEIRKECLPILEQAGITADRETIAIFCNLAAWDDEELTFVHNSPYYAGGDYRRGTAWQIDSPELDVKNLTLKTPIIRDGEYGRISLGKHNSIFIGGMAHELGHALGLPHCRERPDESVRGSALMGSGNRTYGNELRGEGSGTFLTFAHALRLASHPQFSGRLERQTSRGHATLSEFDVNTDGTGIVVSGIVRGEPPIYGVVGYFDPEGGDDYDSTTATAVPDQNGRFQFRCDALKRNSLSDLRLRLLHANGSATDEQRLPNLRSSYSVGANGVPDLSGTRLKLSLESFLEAFNQGDQQLAQRALQELTSDDAKAIAEKLLSPAQRHQSPAEHQSADSTVGLTRFKPSSANVGWLKPAYDRLPNKSILLESGGQVFRTGIYAHAPATHEYHLGKQWSQLSGSVGIAAGHNTGTVRFAIHGDGKPIWTSPIVRTGKVIRFDVSVEGVDRLELVTRPTDDGATEDWGLWLDPELSRPKSP